MAKKQVMFTFSKLRAKEPIIYNMGKQFNVITNIRRADMAEDRDWVVLEVEGKAKDIEQGIKWVTDQGVRVDPVTGDIVEG